MDAGSRRPVVIVTGSDSGIGRATALTLARDGFDVGITYHRRERAAREVADEVARIGGRAVVRQLDLADFDRVERTIDELVEELGGLHAFVANAGTNRAKPVLETELEDFLAIIDVDLTGTFLATRQAARHLVRLGGGQIVTVTSIHEHVPLHGSAAYCAAKGGLGMLTKAMALELAEHNVVVNAVAPGEIATAMNGAEDVDVMEEERTFIPAGRPGDPLEVAELVAFLCSDRATYMTGSSLTVDGGLTLMAAIPNQAEGA